MIVARIFKWTLASIHIVTSNRDLVGARPSPSILVDLMYCVIYAYASGAGARRHGWSSCGLFIDSAVHDLKLHKQYS